jgi:hypothetical protein
LSLPSSIKKFGYAFDYNNSENNEQHQPPPQGLKQKKRRSHQINNKTSDIDQRSAMRNKLTKKVISNPIRDSNKIIYSPCEI